MTDNKNSGWYVKNLGDAMLAGEALEQVKAVFLSEYSKSDDADDMALYIRHESEGQLHCDLKLYFSPAAADIAETVDARSCRRPAPEGLGLLAGSKNARDLLFAEN